jgi:hypothetical protein
MGKYSLFPAPNALVEFGINKPQIAMARQAHMADHIWRDRGGMLMTVEDTAGASLRSAWLAGDVLDAALRVSLRDLNARFLDCLRRMPEEELGLLGFVPAVARLMRATDADSTPLIAACPYALFDAAFRRHEYWYAMCASAGTPAVPEEDAALPAEHQQEYVTLTEMALFFAWHLATTNLLATRLVLGMSTATAELIRSSTLPTITGVVRIRRRLLRPRWPERTLFWRRLLAITPQSSFEEATVAQLTGIQLMATAECLEQLPAATASRRR